MPISNSSDLNLHFKVLESIANVLNDCNKKQTVLVLLDLRTLFLNLYMMTVVGVIRRGSISCYADDPQLYAGVIAEKNPEPEVFNPPSNT